MLRHIFCAFLFFSPSLSVASGFAQDLEIALEQDSQEKLIAFLENRQKRVPPISDNELEAKFEFERTVYDIFEFFYTPLNITRYKLFDRQKDLYQNVRYILVQNTIDVYFVQSIDESNLQPYINAYHTDALWEQTKSRLRLLDFRPRVTVENAKTIYLTHSLERTLESFMRRPQTREKDAESRKAESKKRLNFLNEQFRVMLSHWGTGWHFVTHPHVRSIILDESRHHALIDFRIKHGGTFVFLTRTENGWTMNPTNTHWTE